MSLFILEGEKRQKQNQTHHGFAFKGSRRWGGVGGEPIPNHFSLLLFPMPWDTISQSVQVEGSIWGRGLISMAGLRRVWNPHVSLPGIQNLWGFHGPWPGVCYHVIESCTACMGWNTVADVARDEGRTCRGGISRAPRGDVCCERGRGYSTSEEVERRGTGGSLRGPEMGITESSC